ncbi:MAG: cobalamin biosynthesis protein, partial [Candidatus Helarchaeota archaeon]|nr:cobalamin biosynthesis protein [Candidatus Helarchaeota archaeon]
MDFFKFLFDFFIFHLIILLSALIFDLILGDPPSRLHPVIWIGKLINSLKSKLKSKSPNTPKWDKLKGFLITFLSLIIFLAPLGIGFWLIKKFLIEYLEIYGILIYVLVIAVFFKSSFAIRCLRDSTIPIAREIENGELSIAKSYLNMIVRRDPKDLTEEQVISAAVESIAESSVDGITSPIFFFFIFNLVGCFF